MPLTSADIDRHADGLCAYVDASPSPYHAVEAAAGALDAAGWTRMDETRPWTSTERGYVVREGALFAWDARGARGAGDPFRIVGAHTDSPNLRIRPNPDLRRGPWDQLGVEVYGGPLLNSWLDRDLGLSGRVAVRGAGGRPDVRLLRVDEPLLRVAQLAVHLDRAANDGLTLNPQLHLHPIWGATGEAPTFAAYLAQRLDVATADVLAWDVMTHDLTPSRRLGHAQDLVAAPRLDNLASCYAGTTALVDAGPVEGLVQVVVLFDHEEIGSLTNRGGDSQFLPALLERLVLARGGTREDYLRAVAGSVVASADMAHALHPNYPERHDADHAPLLGAGPVVKVNSRGRYATDATGAAYVALACDQAGVPLQRFIARGDMPCGGTIGPMAASLTGAVTVDLGAPMLSMHSARELTGVADLAAYVACLRAFLAPAEPALPA